MPFWSRLFGTRGSQAAEASRPEDYKGFRITPEPIREGSTYRIAARIEKEVNGTARLHRLVRADTVSSPDEARDLSLRKARQMIDEQGERLFD